MQIGSGSETSRKCHGDSGGPTYMDVTTTSDVKQRVIGVTSHAYDESDCAKGGIDTRIDLGVGEGVAENKVAVLFEKRFLVGSE